MNPWEVWEGKHSKAKCILNIQHAQHNEYSDVTFVLGSYTRLSLHINRLNVIVPRITAEWTHLVNICSMVHGWEDSTVKHWINYAIESYKILTQY